MNGRLCRRVTNILLLVVVLLLYVSHSAKSQALKAVSDEEAEENERRITQNVVRLAATDQLNSEIITNRTRAYLSCESGEMIVQINFSEPFRGIGYSDYDRTSPCKFYGDGGRYYQMRLPLKGCGTKQEAPRLFINNIILRFHRTLELEEDEIKTIVCRYPPPLAPAPPSFSAPILEAPPAPPVPIPAKLSEVELMLIISALLFLTLVLLGIGMAYYCLKRRNIKVVRKRRIISGPPSEITKISTIEAIRIPRVAVSTSSSEPLVSSDYPSSSEERSVVSETSTIRRDQYKYENQAFVPEPYPLDIEREESITSLPVPMIAKPNITQLDFLTTLRSTQHFTDTDIYNTRHLKTTTQLYKPPSIEAPSLYGSIPDNDDWSHSEFDFVPPKRPYVGPPHYDVRNLDDLYRTTQYLTDVDEDITTHRQATHQPKITTRTLDDRYITPQEETDITEDITTERRTIYPPPNITTKTIDDRYITPQETTDITEDTTVERLTTYPPPPITTKTEDDRFIDVRETTEITDDTNTRRLVQYPQPKYTVHTTDDTYITKITETDATEHIVKSDTQVAPPPRPMRELPRTTRREDWESQITRILVGPAQPTTVLPETKTTTTETYDTYVKDVRGVTDITDTTTTDRRLTDTTTTDRRFDSTTTDRFDTTTTDRRFDATTTDRYDSTTIDRQIDTTTVDQTLSSYEFTSVRPPPRPPTKIEVIHRVIESPPPHLPGVERITTDVKQTLRTVITTDEVFRTLITESTTIEEYTHISRDIRYERLFEPPVWVTLIRLFSLPEVQSAPISPDWPQPDSRPPPLPTRYRRRGSLPSVSGDFEPFEPPYVRPESIRSRRTSKSGSIFDVRSLTEEDVTFSRTDSIRFSSTTGGYPLRPSARYLDDVPTIPTTTLPSLRRPSPIRTTYLSEFVSPPERPYSPDIDALSLAMPSRPSGTYVTSRYMSSYGASTANYDRLAQIRRTLERTSSLDEQSKSVTETDVHDWRRY